jgi:hypothetical protein
LNVNGLKGNGIDKDLNTGIQPSTEYSPGTPASIFAYEFTTSLQISGHAMATLGCRANGNPEFCLFTNSEGGVSFSSIWDNSVSRAVSGLTPNPGFFLASRTDAATHTLYFANSANPWAAIGSSSVATIGTPPDSIQINVFSEPVSGLPGAFFYSDRRISCAGIGYGLTSEQGRLLYNGIHALRIAFGGGSV